jgi:ankyrin repeat protein
VCVSDEHSLALRRLFKTVEGTTICKSIRNNDLKNLRMLLAKSPKYANFRLTSGQTPLVLAFAYNKPEAVRLLLQHGAKVNKEVGHLNHTSGCYKLEFGPAILSVNSAESIRSFTSKCYRSALKCAPACGKDFMLLQSGQTVGDFAIAFDSQVPV